MTLPSSGVLDFNSIRAEFGSPSSNVYMNLYYRGGPYTYNVPANAAITTSSTGQLSVSNFYNTEGTTKYAYGPGGGYNTGGKVPQQSYGIGGTGLPAMSDTSCYVGSTSGTMTVFYTISGVIDNFFFTFTPSGKSNSQFTSRSIYCYNTSGTLIQHMTTSASCGNGSTSIEPSGSYSFFNDNVRAGIDGTTLATFSTGSTTGSQLNTTFAIKAF
jgi:hypothetical protein